MGGIDQRIGLCSLAKLMEVMRFHESTSSKHQEMQLVAIHDVLEGPGPFFWTTDKD